MKDSKNQIIRSMKSYETGGSSDDPCIEEYIAEDGKKKKEEDLNVEKLKHLELEVMKKN